MNSYTKINPLETKCRHRSGAALLVVLVIVFAVSIISLGYLARSDTALAAGANMPVRMQMDYLANAALQHAKAVILNPYNVNTSLGYWTGSSKNQLDSNSDLYYDIKISPVGSGYAPKCSYDITVSAYKEDQPGHIAAKSVLQSRLRIDPFIAYAQFDKQFLPEQVSINGDIYLERTISVVSPVNGDIYYRYPPSSVASTLKGHLYYSDTCPVSTPNIRVSDFDSHYYIGSTRYSVRTITTDILSYVAFSPTFANPAGVLYHDGNLILRNNVNIKGMLVVNGDLIIDANANVNITAVKNFPALIVAHDINITSAGTRFVVNGYAKVGHHIDMHSKNSASIEVNGALFIFGDGIKNTSSCLVTINADPFKAALRIWPSAGVSEEWTPAGGAFFKSISRP